MMEPKMLIEFPLFCRKAAAPQQAIADSASTSNASAMTKLPSRGIALRIIFQLRLADRPRSLERMQIYLV
jgi:hypothetical protein